MLFVFSGQKDSAQMPFILRCVQCMVEKVSLRRNDLAAASIAFLQQAFKNVLIDWINI